MSASSRSSGLGLLYRPLTLFKWLIFLCVPVLLWVAAHVQLISDYFTAQAVRNRNRAEVAKLEVKYASLLKEKAELRTGGLAAEKTLRGRYKMRKHDEKVIIVEEEPLNPPSDSAKTGAGAPPTEEVPRAEYGVQLPEQDPEIEAADPAVEAAEPVVDGAAAESQVDAGEPADTDVDTEVAPDERR